MPRKDGSPCRSSVWIAALSVLVACCAEGARPEAAAEMARAVIAGHTFEVELALDAETRQRGLSGRASIPRNGGMLFVWPGSGPQAMVMRDCRVPIDVAFLDASGWVLAVHAMAVEAPRRSGESRLAYEARLRRHGSLAPARMAIEVAGGRLAELGLKKGQRVAIEGGRQLLARAR